MIAMLDDEQRLDAEYYGSHDAVYTARAAQLAWAKRPIRKRLRIIANVRTLLAAQTTELARAAASITDRPLSEKMVSEVLPLLDACRFLEKNAARILRSRRYGAAGRPLWLHGSSFRLHRKPMGVILIVSPGNYPLFLPAVQMLQAITAGNAVVIKPAEGASGPICAFVEHVLKPAGIPNDIVQILAEAPEAARAAVRCGVDKVIFTGSSQNGRDFLAQLAKANTPSVMELSGADTIYVRADANVQLAARAIAFGLQLNDGNTCMAPHAIVVHVDASAALTSALRQHGIGAEELFVVRDDAEALYVAESNEHGLGAAIFSRDENAAHAFADQLATGFVTINDIIVPTADPRMPFGGVRGSGFGMTRGAEGLLEMTHPQAVAVRRARFLPHLDAPHPEDAQLFAAFAMMLHGRGFRERWNALVQLVQLGRRRMKLKRGQK
ncbi:MAG: aldehyde dehydrogenase family protein [Chthoniobacterales bacterium]|nr:aldehyde dehydrogenase family protein [Chthoniobacterales bacterium]